MLARESALFLTLPLCCVVPFEVLGDHEQRLNQHPVINISALHTPSHHPPPRPTPNTKITLGIVGHEPSPAP